jgi:hypothetical protein
MSLVFFFALALFTIPAVGWSPSEPRPTQALFVVQKEAQKRNFQGRSGLLPEGVKNRVFNSSWRKGCPVSLGRLAYLQVAFWGFDGTVHKGELIVDALLAEEVLEIFKELFDAKFPIEKMRLVDDYAASDEKSMEDNNTSAFNCRWVHGRKNIFSKHSYGRAIDINPLINPYVSKKEVVPKRGMVYTDRRKTAKGMIRSDDACVRAFTRRGWIWGGNWRSIKDYQHFEKKTKYGSD